MIFAIKLADPRRADHWGSVTRCPRNNARFRVTYHGRLGPLWHATRNTLQEALGFALRDGMTVVGFRGPDAPAAVRAASDALALFAYWQAEYHEVEREGDRLAAN